MTPRAWLRRVRPTREMVETMRAIVLDAEHRHPYNPADEEDAVFNELVTEILHELAAAKIALVDHGG